MAHDLTSNEARKWGFNTRLLHAERPERFADGATLPPVSQVNAYANDTAEDHEAVFANRKPGFAYSRVANPTVAALERAVNRVEGGAATIAYASGMAALMACFAAICTEGDEILAAPGLYGGTVELFGLLRQLGVCVRYARENTPRAFAAQMGERTRAVFAETIGNPKLDIADIAGLAEVAHAGKVPLVVDNTVTTPYLVRPLELGADIVIHSTSKFIDGNSDAIGGTLTYSGNFKWDFEKFPGLKPFERFRALALVPRLKNDVSPALGGCMAPQTAFYTLIGFETLGLRMERICSSAQTLADHLEAHAGEYGAVVSYPGLASHLQHGLASTQFGGKFGGILTLRLGTKERAYRLLNALELASIVSNIGDTRTLVVHPATTIAAHLSPDEQLVSGVYPDMIRICVGIEDVGDLVADFDQAFARIQEGE